MGKKLIIFLFLLSAFILGSFSSSVCLDTYPIDIDGKDKNKFVQAKLFLDTNAVYKGENLWCSNVIHKGEKTTFVFYSGTQKNVVERRFFGIYNKIESCPCFPISVSFINDSMFVE